MNDNFPDMFEKIAGFIAENDDFLVTAHFSPDGDAVGSVLAMGEMLGKLGKKRLIAIEGGLPEKYDFIDGKAAVVDPQAISNPGLCENAVILDAGSIKRIGTASKLVADGAGIVNIDHHISNDRFGNLAYVDSEASSTCEILYQLARYMEIPVDKDLASYLYVGIMTDTGRFRFANSTPRAFSICAELVACGAEPAELTDAVYYDLPRDYITALAKSLSSLGFHGDGRIALMEYLEAKEIEDAEGFIDFALGIREVKAAAFIRLIPDGRFKVSLRARDSLDVGAIAQSYGGGGHKKAAGFRYRGELETLKSGLVSTIISRLEEK